MPNELHRHPNSLRLDDYDYSQSGAYFVTTIIEGRPMAFGHVDGEDMILTPPGEITQQVWLDLPKHYAGLDLDAFCVMPNHIHGIIILHESPTMDIHPKSLSEIMRGFKTFSARKINELPGRKGKFIWQRGFHDHIIRNERELENIRTYILNNPAHWAEDPDNPYAVIQKKDSGNR